ncbi:helix-turn-helix domain-containing protein [Paenibacillus daejeonensis]|uniref:helix-turn-helix domain-containing protein n=1 Tax=Paenibacillus daejeonensis TaxID=135193 RepID=UPI00036BE5D7|nr:helix-turn-helix transcriptional regulator [Paenibacillus daejeonensis]
MAITYKPLWRQLVNKGMTKTEFRIQAEISTSTLAKMGKDEYVALKIIDDICNTLDCQVSEVIEHIKEPTE